ncbi:hypothetical protein F511_12299 [Dorcoceras hygrometricum]|uniref:Uncharacterized protein n=1 Tax=Dorcoceras hygrometricum TaxID=472368 RepID=A0A2Z7BXN7_9LAMI|nr:hypothetical protein F511_12299 [Dorcoceras hygrometricum]
MFASRARADFPCLREVSSRGWGCDAITAIRRDPLALPSGPITRGRSKKFKEALHGLILSTQEMFKEEGNPAHEKLVGGCVRYRCSISESVSIQVFDLFPDLDAASYIVSSKFSETQLELVRRNLMGSDDNLSGEILLGKKAESDGSLNGLRSNDNFVVEMEPFSFTIDKLMNINPTVTRNFSRKASTRVGDSILNVNQRVTRSPSTSSRGMDNMSTATSLHGDRTAEEAADDSAAPLLHHQITISNGTVDASASESKPVAKRFSFRSRSIDPRRDIPLLRNYVSQIHIVNV